MSENLRHFVGEKYSRLIIGLVSWEEWNCVVSLAEVYGSILLES